VQGIYDLAVPRMVFGRVVLVGDAAFVVRPHTTASTAKAMADALRLGQILGSGTQDVSASLAVWERDRLSAGQQLIDLGVSLGTRSQFGPVRRV
jgi:2,6-dihydroxypyridine 3-monooxygenase